MGNNYDIILIGLVAIFLILRLRSVLGKRTGEERPPAQDPFAPPTPPTAPPAASGPNSGGKDNVIPLPGASAPPRTSQPTSGPGGIRATVLPTALAGVAAVRAADPGFDALGFAAGARSAFATIVEAFAKGETATLKPLLDAPTYKSFEQAISSRVSRRETAETTLIGFEASDIAAAEMQGTDALVTVRFVSEQINVTRDAEGQVADGNPNEVVKAIDLWSFRRNTTSSDPNWVLTKTESEG